MSLNKIESVTAYMVPNTLSKTFAPDPWLKNLLQTEVYRLVPETLGDKARSGPSFVDAWKRFLNQRVFVYAKIPTGNTSLANFLEASNFRLVDTNVVFEKLIGISKASAPISPDRIRFGEAADEEQVALLARKSFVFSRFHLDEQIGPTLANIIKEEWVRNYFRGVRGERLIVATVKERIAGFLQLLLPTKSDTMTIDLIAVDSEFRGMGFGSDMISFTEANFPDRKKFQVGTQIVNTPSVRLYENIGFRLAQSSYVFHYHGV